MKVEELIAAIKAQDLRAVEQALKDKPLLNEIRNSHVKIPKGQGPLWWAIERDNPVITLMLLKLDEVCVGLDVENFVTLRHALAKGNPEIIRGMLETIEKYHNFGMKEMPFDLKKNVQEYLGKAAPKQQPIKPPKQPPIKAAVAPAPIKRQPPAMAGAAVAPIKPQRKPPVMAGAAAAPIAPGHARAQKKPANNSLPFFKVTQGNKQFFVLGTSHDLSLKNFPKNVKDTLLSNTRLILEYFREDEASLEDDLEKYKRLDPQKKGLDQFDKKTQGVILRRLKGTPFGTAHQLNQFKPWVIFYLYYNFGNKKIGMDQELSDEFEKRGHEIVGLETESDAIEAYGLHRLNVQQCSELIKIIELERDLPDNYFKVDGIDYTKKSLQEVHANQFSHNGLDIRNSNWAKKLPDLLENEEPTLIAVGAAHLGGEQGLLNLLQKQAKVKGEKFDVEICDHQGKFSRIAVEDTFLVQKPAPRM